MRLGFQPGAQDNSYLYEWEIFQSAFDAERSGMTLSRSGADPVEFDFGDDYLFGNWRSYAPREVGGGVIFGGDMGKATLESMDVEDVWILSVEGKGIGSRASSNLAERGALGVIVLPDDDADKSVEERYGRLVGQMTRPRLSFKEPNTSRRGFPAIHLKASAADQLPEFDATSMKPGEELGWVIDETSAAAGDGKVTMENVVGVWPGSDPELKNEVIILSAHYDHVGEREDGTIYNGADDNGSGTCGLLAIAEALKEYGPMRRSVMLMWVSAEEKGLLGSAAWTKDPYLPDGMKALCNINIDMIGRNASNEFLITPTQEHEAYSALTKVAEANAAVEGFTKIKSADAYWQRSDQYNFEKNMNLPVAFLFCDVHEDYHQPSDTPDKINYDKMRRICRLVVRMLEALQIDKPQF